jgi:hypothetical protein
MSTARTDQLTGMPPSYAGRSIVNLMASIVSASGGEPQYAELEGIDSQRLASAQHIVLLVIDGLGFEFLQSCPAGHVLRQHLKRSMTTVFPPTTATAITTFLTGLAPRQHGLTGWFTYFKELGAVVTVLPFTTRLGSVQLERLGVSAHMLFGHVPVFNSMARTSFSVAPSRIAHSEFNRSHTGNAELRPYNSLPEFFWTIESVVKQTKGQSFTYAYWPEFDHLSHLNGVNSEAVKHHLAELDAGIDGLLHEISGTDTLLVVTADHGFVDIPPDQIVRVSDHPELRDALRVPLCGEPRTAYAYVSPARSRSFVDYVQSELSGSASCVESEVLIERGFFGPGTDHPRLRDRIGDFALLMRDGYAIQDTLPGEEPPALIGMHGGSSSAELEVPLIIAEV